MKNRIGSLKRALFGLAIVAAFAILPAFASGAYLSDAGSNYVTVRVNGYDFTPNTPVYVVAIDQLTSVQLQQGWVTTTPYFGCTQYGCYGGGDFYYYGIDASSCSGVGRDVWAWDSGAYTWVGPLSVSCFTPPA